jgi:hypothetical protein
VGQDEKRGSMRNRICNLLGLVPVAAGVFLMLIATPLWAGPAEDRALFDACGCSSSKRVDLEGIKAALELGANPNAPNASGGRQSFTPLECAALSLAGRHDATEAGPTVDVAKLLFNAGAKLRDTSLFFPISSGNVEMVRLLIDKGASPTAKIEGFTPPELARKYGQTAVYDYLISRGGVAVDSSVTAQLMLIAAAANAATTSTMERAIREGARVDGVGPDGRTPLSLSIHRLAPTITEPTRTGEQKAALKGLTGSPFTSSSL